MKYFDSTGREVGILQTDGGYDDYYIVSAMYLDTKPDESDLVPDSELEYLQEKYAEEVSMLEHEKQISAAEARYEGDR